MLHLLKSRPGFLCDGVSRREWLQLGGLSVAGLTLPTLLRAEAASQRRPPAKGGAAKSCIILWLAGGPSQPDMWDMKPDAPAQIRGEFKPLRTTVPGILMSEHLPRLSRLAHHVTLVNSLHHNVGHAHCAASYYVLTGE